MKTGLYALILMLCIASTASAGDLNIYLGPASPVPPCRPAPRPRTGFWYYVPPPKFEFRYKDRHRHYHCPPPRRHHPPSNRFGRM